MNEQTHGIFRLVICVLDGACPRLFDMLPAWKFPCWNVLVIYSWWMYCFSMTRKLCACKSNPPDLEWRQMHAGTDSLHYSQLMLHKILQQLCEVACSRFKNDKVSTMNAHFCGHNMANEWISHHVQAIATNSGMLREEPKQSHQRLLVQHHSELLPLHLPPPQPSLSDCHCTAHLNVALQAAGAAVRGHYGRVGGRGGQPVATVRGGG